MKSKLNLSAPACRRIAQLGMLATLTGVICTAAPIQWGLTVTNINNPITPLISTNSDKSLTIIAGGGDTYSAPDSFTFAYEVLNGDFDVKVRVINVK